MSTYRALVFSACELYLLLLTIQGTIFTARQCVED